MEKIKERKTAFIKIEKKNEEWEKRLQNQTNNIFEFMKVAGINEAQKKYE